MELISICADVKSAAPLTSGYTNVNVWLAPLPEEGLTDTACGAPPATVNVLALDVTPPGSTTVTLAAPACEMLPAGTSAVNWVLLTNVSWSRGRHSNTPGFRRPIRIRLPSG